MRSGSSWFVAGAWNQVVVWAGALEGAVPLAVLPVVLDGAVAVPVVTADVDPGTGAVVDMAGLAPPLLLVTMPPAVLEPVWIVSVVPALSELLSLWHPSATAAASAATKTGTSARLMYPPFASGESVKEQLPRPIISTDAPAG